MGRTRKFDYQAAIQDNLIAASGGLTLDELLERSGLEVDRSTLFRHLTSLIQQGRVERLGKARASRYRPLCVVDKYEKQAQPETLPAPVRSAPVALDRFFSNSTSLLHLEASQQLDAAGQVEWPVAAPDAVHADDRTRAEYAPDEPASVDAAPPKPDFAGSNRGSTENDHQEPAETPSGHVPAADYSVAIRKAVRIVVREWKRCDRRNLQIYLSLLAEPEYVDALTETVERELAGLREGDLEKFGLTSAEFSEFDPTSYSAATGD